MLPMKSRSEILKLVQAKICLRHFAISTEQTYGHWVGRYYDYCLSLPKPWSAERKTEAFLTDLALKQGVAARTQNQALSALLFLYAEVLQKPLGDINALRAKQPIHERTAPSRALDLRIKDVLWGAFTGQLHPPVAGAVFSPCWLVLFHRNAPRFHENKQLINHESVVLVELLN